MDRISIADTAGLTGCPNFGDEEFLAEEFPVQVTVASGRRLPSLPLSSGTISPTRALQTIEVPLWAGLWLERRKFVTIHTPSWFSTEWVNAAVEKERTERDRSKLLPLPARFLEICTLLMNDHGTESLRVAIEDLIAIRKTKILESVRTIDAYTPAVDVTGLTSAERSAIRTGVSGLLCSLSSLTKPQNSSMGA